MKIFNRSFSHQYNKIESYEAGIILTGDEVKSVKLGRINLDDAYIKIIGSEAYLVNAEISPYQNKPFLTQDLRRTRKLLLHKKEIIRLKTKTKSGGLTIVPVSCYNKGKIIKVEIALVRGKKDIEKRKREKAKEIQREEERKAKEYLKRG
jgi:SsrA-binding protein